MTTTSRAILVLTVAASASLAWADSPVAEELRLVPFPKEVSVRAGVFALDRPLTLELPVGASPAIVSSIEAEFRRAGLAALKVAASSGPHLVIHAGERVDVTVPECRQDVGDEAYVLVVEPSSIHIDGKGATGFFYGAATLCQLVRANRIGNSIPCVTIQDWPSIRWRAFQDDLTRNPSSTLAELERELSLGAGFKLNLFTYYMENQFAFRKHPIIGPEDGSLRPDELRALVEAGRPLHMEIMGNQQSFGHFQNILKHEQYKALRETTWVLSPVNEDTYQLLDDMYSEVIPLVPFPFFNVCCDETQGLGTGPSKQLAARIGEGGVYVQHIKRVYDLVRGKYGKRMMMWGDIILNHPDKLSEIPKDTIMLTWGYHVADSFESQILPFAKSGYEFFVCPGVSNWNRILPEFEMATINIRNFVRDGAKHGTIGVLNTAWDDDGETLNAPNWYGFAWGAECSWNASTTTPEQFTRRIGAVLFGEKGDHFGQAVEQLKKASKLPGMRRLFNSRFWQLEVGQPTATVRGMRSEAEQLLAIVGPALEHLEAVRAEASVNAELLDPLIYNTKRVQLIGRRMLDGLAAAEAYRDACEGPAHEARPAIERAERLIRANAQAHRQLAEEFKTLWARENKPYGLDRVLGRYSELIGKYDALAAKLASAREALDAGKRIPWPAEVGLEMLETSVRRTRAHRGEAAPLSADEKWVDDSASSRLGLVVNAGKCDRTDLPIELLVRVPQGFVGRPVRAVVCGEDGAAGELPAQLDATDEPGLGRLVIMINRRLPAQSELRLHVYLGTASRETLQQAVRTRSAEDGAKWLENDQVRLMLGAEGAHIYKWHVKALGDRDVTMPGETGWFGFADLLGEHRTSPNRLECTASGPALVRYECTDNAGVIKTVSLFAGVSWMEVTIDRPAWYYWNFDDPANFAADSSTPGQFLFSNGHAGAVGKQGDGAAGQVKANEVSWAVKYIPNQWALGMVVPEAPAILAVGPGGGYGGVGLEGEKPASHFVTFAGRLTGSPAALMQSLQQTLGFRDPPVVTLYAIQSR